MSEFHLAGPDTIPLAEASQDFGYSLGVLHHIPDTAGGDGGLRPKLKPGAPFLVYLYYDFENRPALVPRLCGRRPTLARRVIARLPVPSCARSLTTAIAARRLLAARPNRAVLERRGGKVGAHAAQLLPQPQLLFDADRRARPFRHAARAALFAQRRSGKMMERCGLKDIRFSDGEPYWVACGIKA